MNVLSLFDGMSCTQIALERAGIHVTNYFASELDKNAIKITMKNYPATIQLGDVTKIDYHKLPKIDLLVGGSPCQGFSFAGKQLNFNDPRSRLFFNFFTAMMQVKPTYFLLENVRMKKEYQDVISQWLGVEPIMIDSNLVSAQNRKRFYWTNIPGVGQPMDRHIMLKDIIQYDVTEPNSEAWHRYFERRKDKMQFKSYIGVMNDLDKSLTCVARQGTNSWSGNIFQLTQMRSEEGRRIRREARLQTGKDFSPRKYQELVPRTDGKANTLTTDLTEQSIVGPRYRFLTCIEAERLQTVPDNYTEGVSTSARYKMLGNGFTVEVIAWILAHLPA